MAVAMLMQQHFPLFMTFSNFMLLIDLVTHS